MTSTLMRCCVKAARNRDMMPQVYGCGAARELKIPLTDLARKLGMTVSGIGYAVQRGETIALRYNYQLLE